MTTTTKPSEKELTDYYRKIEKALPCSAETKKKILFDLKSNIAEYFDEYPEAEMSDIINHFGTPDLFASEYVASLEDAELNKKVHKSKWIKRGVIICCSSCCFAYSNNDDMGYSRKFARCRLLLSRRHY